MNGPSGQVVKVLTWIIKDLDLSPTWFQFFSVKSYRCLRKDLFLIIIITSGKSDDITQRVFPLNQYVLHVKDATVSSCVSRAVTRNEWTQWSSG